MRVCENVLIMYLQHGRWPQGSDSVCAVIFELKDDITTKSVIGSPYEAPRVTRERATIKRQLADTLRAQLPAWARNCSRVTSATESPKQLCPCGQGPCKMLTSNTARNPHRKFYRCPKSENEGGCRFFQWADQHAPPGGPPSHQPQSFVTLPPPTQTLAPAFLDLTPLPATHPTSFIFPAASPTPIAPSPLSPSPVIPGRPKPSSPAHEPPLLTPPSHLPKRAECEVLTGEGSRLRNRSLDQSLGRRLFDETGSPEQQLQPKDTPTGSFELVEKRFMDSGRSQWVFLNTEETENEGGDRVAGKACHARVREPRVRIHTTRAERRWHTLLARALSAASQPPLTPGHAPPPVPFAFPLVHACAARAAPGGMATL